MNSKEDAKRFVAGMCETEAEFMHALNIGLILESMGCSDELPSFAVYFFKPSF